MPGVPRSRGCDACRKQKKKCDQKQPQCGRCERLDIPCIGIGARRIKFLYENAQTLEAKALQIRTSSSSSSASASPPSSAAAGGASPSSPPINPFALISASETSHVSSFFISRLEITDVRYDLSTYGGFMKLLPQRLGTSKALDTSVDAFSTAMVHLSRGEKSIEPTKKYVVACRTIREELSNPASSCSMELICAIYLVMLSQAWLGRKVEKMIRHEEGLMCLLEAMHRNGFEGEFENSVIIVMCVPVIMMSVMNPRIKLKPWFWDLLKKVIPFKPVGPQRYSTKMMREDPSTYPSLSLLAVAKLKAFINEPELHQADILTCYHNAASDVPKFFSKLTYYVGDGGSGSVGFESVNARVGRDLLAALSMCLNQVIVLNQLLLAFEPSGHDALLDRDNVLYVQRIIDTAERGRDLRPLGSGYVVGLCSPAYAAAQDEASRDKLAALMQEFMTDLSDERWDYIANWWHWRLMMVRFRLGNPRPTDDLVEAQAHMEPGFDPFECVGTQDYPEDLA